MNPTDSESWLSALRSFLEAQFTVQSQFTAQHLVVCGLAVTVGLLLVFASARLARPLVALIGFLVGGAAVLTFEDDLGVSKPLAAAVGGVIVSWIAFRTYRFWLLIATVAIVVGIVLVAQMDHASLEQLLQSKVPESNKLTTLAQPEQPAHMFTQDWQQQLTQRWDRVRQYCAGLGVRGSILPIVAAVLAIVVALRAARGLAAIWLSLIGAMLTAGAAISIVMVQWPQARADIIENSQWLLAGIAGLWLLGLLTQARQLVRTRSAAAPAPTPARDKTS